MKATVTTEITFILPNELEQLQAFYSTIDRRYWKCKMPQNKKEVTFIYKKTKNINKEITHEESNVDSRGSRWYSRLRR